MTFKESLVSVGRKNYANFSGRASRSEFWWWYLAVLIIEALINAITYSDNFAPIGTTISVIILLALFIPTLAVGVRRLHDTNRSGWNLLWQLIPLVGFIIVLVFLVQEGTQGENRFGSQPA